MNDKEHKKLAETIHDAVWSANQGMISPCNNGPPDLFGMIIGGGIVILMIYALLKMP